VSGRNGKGAALLEGLRSMERSDLESLLLVEAEQFTMLEERLAELELELEDAGWLKEGAEAENEFSAGGLKKLVALSRIMYLRNPLIRNAVDVQTNYVFAQGVTFSAPTPEVDEVVQGFLNDRQNLVEFTSHEARIGKETQLQNEGQIFFVLWTDDSDSDKKGHITVRTIPVEQILDGDIIHNPEDAREVWFYKRVSQERSLDLTTGRIGQPRRVVRYYPDWRYLLKVEEDELDMPEQLGEQGSQDRGEVLWNAPVYHLKVGGLHNMRFGIPEKYPAFSWARAVSQDLNDYATIRRALARFAWTLAVQGKSSVAAAKEKLNSPQEAFEVLGANGDAVPPATGSTFISKRGSDGKPLADLQPIKTAGAAPSPEEGRRLWLMVAAGSHVPETILSGNADVGNLATAKTLDRPTELHMRNRQTLWADVFRDILGYVINRTTMLTSKIPDTVEVTIRRQAPIEKPPAQIDPLTGLPQAAPDPGFQEDVVTETQETDLSVNVEFPSILERDTNQTIDAIIAAATLSGKSTAKTMPDRVLVDLLLRALGLNEEVSDILEDMFPDGAMWFPKAEAPAAPAEGSQNPDEDPNDVPAPVLPVDLDESVDPEEKFRSALMAFRKKLTE
jgi:hypothetical protein